MYGKAFTVAEANALIPQLEVVLGEITHRIDEVRVNAERLQILDVLWGEKLLSPETPDHAEGEALRIAIATWMGEIEELVEREIHGRGLRFPPGGLEHGLIDFPSTWQGRWVFLCWRRREPEIEAWHEVDGGFAGRREVTPEQVRSMGREGRSSGIDDARDA
ncbi:MAG TPA: DUF2203 domain-containing protein [Longimicrobiaceae bacterium]|nr:DUF2203 domain-containing protein [Longimicrobiaceae bacterium]